MVQTFTLLAYFKYLTTFKCGETLLLPVTIRAFDFPRSSENALEIYYAGKICVFVPIGQKDIAGVVSGGAASSRMLRKFYQYPFWTLFIKTSKCLLALLASHLAPSPPAALHLVRTRSCRNSLRCAFCLFSNYISLFSSQGPHFYRP